jgi:hypothetical protein
MIDYSTGVQNNPPITPDMQRQALAGLLAQGKNRPVNMDVYNGRATAAGVDLERAAAKANNDYILQANQNQQAMGLKGAGLLAQQQQQNNDLSNQRLGMTLGYVGNLMGGLNGLIGGLYQ